MIVQLSTNNVCKVAEQEVRFSNFTFKECIATGISSLRVVDFALGDQRRTAFHRFIVAKSFPHGVKIARVANAVGRLAQFIDLFNGVRSIIPRRM